MTNTHESWADITHQPNREMMSLNRNLDYLSFKIIAKNNELENLQKFTKIYKNLIFDFFLRKCFLVTLPANQIYLGPQFWFEKVQMKWNTSFGKVLNRMKKSKTFLKDFLTKNWTF